MLTAVPLGGATPSSSLSGDLTVVPSSVIEELVMEVAVDALGITSTVNAPDPDILPPPEAEIVMVDPAGVTVTPDPADIVNAPVKEFRLPTLTPSVGTYAEMLPNSSVCHATLTSPDGAGGVVSLSVVWLPNVARYSRRLLGMFMISSAIVVSL